MSFSRHWFAMCVLVLSIVGGSWTLDDGRANELDEDPQMIRLKVNNRCTQSVLSTSKCFKSRRDSINLGNLTPTARLKFRYSLPHGRRMHEKLPKNCMFRKPLRRFHTVKFSAGSKGSVREIRQFLM